MPTDSRILLKLTGKIFLNKKTGGVDAVLARSLAQQIKTLEGTHQFGIVIGGGNFFRGSQQGKQLGLSPWAAHNCGMIATIINGVLLYDMFSQATISTTLVSALECPEIAAPITQQTIEQAVKRGDCIIFAGGTGNPYFTTDTNAIIRALQMGAKQIWKCSSVGGVYQEDPAHNPQATLLKNITYDTALEKHLGIMDATAFALARDNKLLIRVFNIFEQEALIQAAKNPEIGSIIQ